MLKTVRAVHAPAIFAIALCVAACGTVEQDATQVCIGGSAETEVVLDADSPVEVFSRQAYGCGTTVVDHTCEAEVVGDVIEVTTEVGFQNRPRFTCENMLLFSIASCTTPRLEEGTYTIRYAGQEATLELPSSGQVQCLDAP